MSETYDSLAYYRIKQLEETNERLKNELMETRRQLDAECKKKCDLQERLDDVGKRYYESSMRVGKLVREKETLQNQLGSSNAALERLRERYEEEVVCRRKWAKLAVSRDKRIEELQRQIDTLTRKDAAFVDLDSVKLTGMEELWVMLRELPLLSPDEARNFFGWYSISNMVRRIPDVRDFLKKYEAWKKEAEQKRLAEMRNYLDKFCQGHIYLGCPLEAEEFKCGHIDFFKEMIPDKDLQRYYDKAVEEKPSEKEQKRLDYMRDYLHRFCVGKVCYGCPLNTPEFKCYGHGGFDSISDEDLKRYYKKAWESFKEEKTVEEVPCSFGWKLDGTEFTIETSIPKDEYDNIIKIISGKE